MDGAGPAGVARRWTLPDGTEGIVEPEVAHTVMRQLHPRKAKVRNVADWLMHQDIMEEWSAIERARSG